MTLAWRIRGKTMTIQQALDQCLEDMRSEGASVEDCLRRYPEFADELRPLLKTARRLQGTNDVRPNRAYKSRLRQQLVGEEEPEKRRWFSWRLVLVGVFLCALVASALLWLGSSFQAAGGIVTPLPPMMLAGPMPLTFHNLFDAAARIC